MEFINSDDPEELWKLKDLVLAQTSIIELAKEYLTLEERGSGEFTHRCWSVS